MTTSQKIIEYIEEHGQVTGAELADYLDITDRAVRKKRLSKIYFLVGVMVGGTS